VQPIDDSALISRALAGDDDACTELVRQHEDYVYSIALLELRDRALAREVAQDVFVRAFQKLVGFRGEAAFTTWLFRVTINCCRDIQRAQASRRRFIPLENATWLAAPTHDGPDGRLERVETEVRMRRAVASLPAKLRRPLVLRYAGGLDYKAIAAALRLPLGTVCTRLQRAVRLLGEALDKEPRE
jgi:RNA polymerase sigma-70 factor (ECF subfamily)